MFLSDLQIISFLALENARAIANTITIEATFFTQQRGSPELGTTESCTNDGEQKERTEWHNVFFFRKLAKIAGEYISKGSNVYGEGSLKTEKWWAKNTTGSR